MVPPMSAPQTGPDIPRPDARSSGIPLAWLAAALLAMAAIGNLLLPAFLGLPPMLDTLFVIVGVAAIGWVTVARPDAITERIDGRTILACLAIACVLLLLGGEGRLLSAPTDWRVRDAVLADLGGHAWPFHYALPDGPAMLRAPLGMYLLPALAGPAGQRALDIALLIQNVLMLGLMLALASSLFAPGRARRIALATLVLFSGFDIVGTLAMRWAGRPAPFFHMENWAPASQYTAPFTQMSWSPQHAIAGWGCALFFLLWQQRKLPIGGLAAAVPLFAFWSPVAAAGAIPFALLAALSGWRAIRPRDVAAGVIAILIILPALIYQHAGSASVASGRNPIDPAIYALAVAIEVLPLALPALLLRGPSRFGRDALLLALAMLLLAPLWRVGLWKDFQMRITIVPLIVTAAAFADLLASAKDGGDRRIVALLATILAIGSLTVASELFPEVTMRAAPAPRCSLIDVWYRQPADIRTGPPNTYVAPVRAMPAMMRMPAKSVIDPARDPQECWSRPWFTPAWIG